MSGFTINPLTVKAQELSKIELGFLLGTLSQIPELNDNINPETSLDEIAALFISNDTPLSQLESALEQLLLKRGELSDKGIDIKPLLTKVYNILCTERKNPSLLTILVTDDNGFRTLPPSKTSPILAYIDSDFALEDILPILTEKGADIDQIHTQYSHATPLAYAAGTQNKKAILSLLRAGAALSYSHEESSEYKNNNVNILYILLQNYHFDIMSIAFLWREMETRASLNIIHHHGYSSFYQMCWEIKTNSKFKDSHMRLLHNMGIEYNIKDTRMVSNKKDTSDITRDQLRDHFDSKRNTDNARTTAIINLEEMGLDKDGHPLKKSPKLGAGAGSGAGAGAGIGAGAGSGAGSSANIPIKTQAETTSSFKESLSFLFDHSDNDDTTERELILVQILELLYKQSITSIEALDKHLEGLTDSEAKVFKKEITNKLLFARLILHANVYDMETEADMDKLDKDTTLWDEAMDEFVLYNGRPALKYMSKPMPSVTIRITKDRLIRSSYQTSSLRAREKVWDTQVVLGKDYKTTKYRGEHGEHSETIRRIVADYNTEFFRATGRDSDDKEGSLFNDNMLINESDHETLILAVAMTQIRRALPETTDLNLETQLFLEERLISRSCAFQKIPGLIDKLLLPHRATPPQTAFFGRYFKANRAFLKVMTERSAELADENSDSSTESASMPLTPLSWMPTIRGLSEDPVNEMSIPEH